MRVAYVILRYQHRNNFGSNVFYTTHKSTHEVEVLSFDDAMTDEQIHQSVNTLMKMITCNALIVHIAIRDELIDDDVVMFRCSCGQQLHLEGIGICNNCGNLHVV